MKEFVVNHHAAKFKILRLVDEALRVIEERKTHGTNWSDKLIKIGGQLSSIGKDIDRFSLRQRIRKVDTGFLPVMRHKSPLFPGNILVISVLAARKKQARGDKKTKILFHGTKNK